MKILHSNADYAAIGSISELRRARRKLRLRISRSEQRIDSRWHELMSFDSLVSAIAPRLTLIKESVAGIVDGYSAIRDYIRACRRKREADEASEQTPEDAPEDAGQQ